MRVLVWAGPPAPVFEPKRSDVEQIRDELTRGTRISCVLDARERTMHCHHEKLVIVDGEVAFVGGIDLTSLGGARWDDTAHPATGRLGWHDVATRLRGPAVADVAKHFRARWQKVAKEPLAAPQPPSPAGETTVQILRTVPDGTYGFVPNGDFRILLNEHSLFNDTEMNVLTCDEELARRTRLELWAEHLERPVEQVDADPTRVIDELWRPIAQEQLRLHRTGQLRTHRLMELPAVSRRTKRLIGPMRGLLVDG